MNWNAIALREVLRLYQGYIPVVDHAQYQIAGIQPYPHGLKLRAKKRGSELQGKPYQQLRAGSFVISRTRAHEKWWALVPHELDAAIIHRNFACFELQATIDQHYFATYLHSQQFRHAVRTARTKQGRLDLRRFARTKLPLPSMDEQRKIAEMWQYATIAIDRTLEMRHAIEALKLTTAGKLFGDSVHASPLATHAAFGYKIEEPHAVYISKTGVVKQGPAEPEDIEIGILPHAELDNRYLYYWLSYQSTNWQTPTEERHAPVAARLARALISVPTIHEQRQCVDLMAQFDDALHKLKIEQQALSQVNHTLIDTIFAQRMSYAELLSMMTQL